MQIPVLVGILSTLLSADNLVRADDLANKFEISKRSVYRYMDMLSAGGVPIESCLGRGGGWRIVENYKLKATYFTEDEYNRLVFSMQSSSLQDDVTKQITQKLQGLKRSHANATVLKSEQFIVDSDDFSVGDRVSVLSECIAQKKLCEIEYHAKDGSDSVRSVEPYCLILKNGMWYVYCFCRLRKGFRYFKVSRIVDLKVTDRFVGRSFRADSSVIQTDVLKDKEMCEVILSIDSVALSACEEWLGVKNVAKMGDGYIAKATLPYDEMLINNVLSLGDGARVEKPQKLRLAVVEKCKRIAKVNASE
ncbi:MAG: YafY family transcriptional regulator [Corallococcus sp.]|nr:YafY family transcriptional regulator [Corallococcus sp.]